jgi:hypothetical protein
MRDDQVFELLSQLNPVPDQGALEIPPVPTARRAGMGIQMQTQTQTRTEPERRPLRGRRIRFAAATAAVIVVAAAGVLVAMIAGGGEDGPDAAASSTQIAETFLTRLDEGDGFGAAALVSDSHSGIRIPMLGLHAGMDGLVDYFDYYGAIGGDTNFTGCVPAGDGGIVSCSINQTTQVSSALGVGPIAGSMTITTRDGRVTAVNFAVPGGDLVAWVDARDDFEAWIASDRSALADQVLDDDGVIRTAVSGALYLRLASEYAAAAEGR